MKKLTIKEPCHENWADFTPTQRGAFCGKCQINVIDFSEKTNQDIKTILLENAGKKMCGRFTKTQLADFNSDYHIWHNQNQTIFQSKFIFALVLTFGLTLFSCTNESETLALNQLNSFIAPTTQVTSNLIEIDTIKQDTVKAKTQQTTCGKAPVIYDEELIMGDMEVLDYPEKEMTKGKIKIEEDSVFIPEPPIVEHYILGMMVSHFEEIEPTPEIIKDTTKTVTNENNIAILTDKFEANLYPNLTKNSASLSINVLAKENYNIAIYDMQGKLIEMIYTGIIEPQEKIFRFNLDQQKNGIYFIKITTETQNESLKLVKSN